MTTTNEFGEGFLELRGGIPAGLKVMCLERDSYSHIQKSHPFPSPEF